mmetsp:Transcript_18358/g.55646  ORF Transcript_18358/g.55646 Transcript_18358/m.55646 type:complete len:340 (-) Transcript_18358:954-1973(-)
MQMCTSAPLSLLPLSLPNGHTLSSKRTSVLPRQLLSDGRRWTCMRSARCPPLRDRHCDCALLRPLKARSQPTPTQHASAGVRASRARLHCSGVVLLGRRRGRDKRVWRELGGRALAWAVDRVLLPRRECAVGGGGFARGGRALPRTIGVARAGPDPLGLEALCLLARRLLGCPLRLLARLLLLLDARVVLLLRGQHRDDGRAVVVEPLARVLLLPRGRHLAQPLVHTWQVLLDGRAQPLLLQQPARDAGALGEQPIRVVGRGAHLRPLLQDALALGEESEELDRGRLPLAQPSLLCLEVVQLLLLVATIAAHRRRQLGGRHVQLGRERGDTRARLGDQL